MAGAELEKCKGTTRSTIFLIDSLFLSHLPFNDAFCSLRKLQSISNIFHSTLLAYHSSNVYAFDNPMYEIFYDADRSFCIAVVQAKNKRSNSSLVLFYLFSLFSLCRRRCFVRPHTLFIRLFRFFHSRSHSNTARDSNAYRI